MVGEKIEKILFEKKMSKKELLDKSGLSRTGLHSIIKGTASPSIETLKKIAEALDVSINTFIGNEENTTENKIFNQEIEKLSDEKVFLSQKLSATKLGYKQQISLLKALTTILKELKNKDITEKNINSGILDEIDSSIIKTYESYYKDIFDEGQYYDLEYEIWLNKLKSNK